MKKLKKKNEDILFESLEKIFNLDGGDIDRDEIYDYIFHRVILEMLVHQEYCRLRIIGQFKRSFIDVFDLHLISKNTALNFAFNPSDLEKRLNTPNI